MTLTVDHPTSRTRRREVSVGPKCIELFSGAGGMAMGLHQAGFEHLALVEIDEAACRTISENNLNGVLQPQWPVLHMDSYAVHYEAWRDSADVVAGGAPCQPFSLGGQHLGQHDNRNLFPEVARAVGAIRPKAFLFENVQGLLRPSFRPYFEYILAQLRRPSLSAKPGESWSEHAQRLTQTSGQDDEYEVDYRVLNAADYGVPQIRRRVLVVGFKKGLGSNWRWPEPTHSARGLPKVSNGSATNALPWLTVRDALRGLPNPIDGTDHPTIHNHRGIPGARAYAGHSGSALDEPAKTLKAGVHGVPGGEGTIRLEDGTIRYMTVREAARIQTFPDEYVFPCSRTKSMRQIGNAVPVLLAFRFGLAIRSALGFDEIRR